MISIIYPSRLTENVTALSKAFARFPQGKGDPVLLLLSQHILQISILTSIQVIAIIVCMFLFISLCYPHVKDFCLPLYGT